MTQLTGRDLTQNALFLVATLGFDERERSALRDLLRVSEYRAPAFRALVKEVGAFPHIVIVNPERPDALAKWEALRRGSEGKAPISGILWGNHQPSQPWKYSLSRPALVTDVMALLDRVVAEEHGYHDRVNTLARGAGLFAISSREMKPESNHAAAVESAIRQPTATTATATAAESSGPDYISTLVIEPPVEIAVVLEATPAPTATAQASPAIPNLPARDVAAEARAPREVVRSRQSAPAQARFLVVDDSLPVRIQMKEALQRFARTIDFAHDGEQAMILIDNCKYDVIFLDVILPGKDGYDVCRYIRNHPLQRQTPVIMLTGNSAPADRIKGKLAGCDTYLIKPVRQGVLTEVIGEFIKAPAVA
jgi:CheY-like chemotaxis protein